MTANADHTLIHGIREDRVREKVFSSCELVLRLGKDTADKETPVDPVNSEWSRLLPSVS